MRRGIHARPPAARNSPGVGSGTYSGLAIDGCMVPYMDTSRVASKFLKF
jgi:hypothetical protein